MPICCCKLLFSSSSDHSYLKIQPTAKFVSLMSWISSSCKYNEILLIVKSILAFFAFSIRIPSNLYVFVNYIHIWICGGWLKSIVHSVQPQEVFVFPLDNSTFPGEIVSYNICLKNANLLQVFSMDNQLYFIEFSFKSFTLKNTSYSKVSLSDELNFTRLQILRNISYLEINPCVFYFFHPNPLKPYVIVNHGHIWICGGWLKSMVHSVRPHRVGGFSWESADSWPLRRLPGRIWQLDFCSGDPDTPLILPITLPSYVKWFSFSKSNSLSLGLIIIVLK